MHNFKSKKKYYHFYRYGFISIAIFILLVWLYLILTERTININGADKTATLENSWMMPIISFVLLGVHMLLHAKAAYIEIDNQIIKIENKNGIIEANVDDIEKINQIQFVKPPLYRLKMKGSKKTYLFVIYDLYIEFGGYIKDLSNKRDILDEIKEKND